MDKRIKPDYIVKNIHTGKVYDVFKARKSLTSLIGDFHLHDTNIIILGLFLLCDLEFINKEENEFTISTSSKATVRI
jgi:hypothetical protein